MSLTPNFGFLFPAIGTYQVAAPMGCSLPRPSALLSVDVEDDEELEWIWTHYSDGSVVTGYRIRLRLQVQSIGNTSLRGR